MSSKTWNSPNHLFIGKAGKDNSYEKISSGVNDYLVKMFAEFIRMVKEDPGFLSHNNTGR